MSAEPYAPSAVPGHWLDGRTSARRAATLGIGAAGRLVVRASDVRDAGGNPEHEELCSAPGWAVVQCSARIGSVPQRVRFPDGSTFETDHHAAFEALAGTARVPGGGVAWLESRWRFAVAALVLVVAATVFGIRDGVPALAAVVATVIPPEVERGIGAQALEALDASLFEPSALAAARQDAVGALLDGFLDPAGDGAGRRAAAEAPAMRVVVRRLADGSANAFALPGGTIIVTDGLVALARDDDELRAVLAHEVGHVRGQHGLRLALQGAGVAMISLVVLGDATALTALAGVVPALIEARHSRAFEREADAFARAWLREHGVAGDAFDAILCRMEQAADPGGGEDAAGGLEGATAWLSSHPPVDERAECLAAAPPGADP